MDRALISSCGQFLATRLYPGDELKDSLIRLTGSLDSSAISVVTCVGSLSRCVLRFAAQKEHVILTGDFEIVSLTGTLCRSGAHLHLAISDSKGATVGGHLVSDALVRTTAEIVLVSLPEMVFDRKFDPQTGHRELVIAPGK